MPHNIFVNFKAFITGVSIFESLANFAEEQQEGVFSKTLKNI